jgi:hypothetical protein
MFLLAHRRMLATLCNVAHLLIFENCLDSTPEPVFLNFKEPGNWFQGIDSASLCSLAGRYDKPIPTRFLAPIDCSKIQEQRAERALRYIKHSQDQRGFTENNSNKIKTKRNQLAVLRIWIQEPGSGAFLTSRSGIWDR